RDLRAGRDQRPLDAGHGEVLAGRADRDRMAFTLQRADHLQREDHDRAIGAAVEPVVALVVAVHAARADPGLEDALLRDAAAGDVDRFEPTQCLAGFSVLCWFPVRSGDALLAVALLRNRPDVAARAAPVIVGFR